ncbi:MAG: MATE family efflux transporter [Clostridiales bacterium]|nr:MATE family efflux transporter [Clostridiales bacterium]
MKTSVRKIDMTEGPLLGKILVYAIPLMLTGTLQLLYNAADMIVVGRFAADGETALAAVGSCGALINLIINLFMGLSVGAGVLVAQYIGAKNYDEVKKTVHTAIPAATILGVVVSIFGFFAAEELLRLTGVEESVLAEAVPYMQVYMLGIPASMVYNYCASMMRSAGDTTHPLLFLSVSGMLNVIFNIVMVVVFGLGAVGVGIATAISTWLSMIFILWFMLRDKGPLHLDLKLLRLNTEKLFRMVKIGVPAGIQGCIFSLSNVVIQTAVNSFGKTVVAGNAAAANIDGFLYNAMNSFYHASLAFVGQNVGANKLHRIRKIAIYCTLMVAACGALLGVVAYTFGRQLLGLYAPGNSGAIETGMIRMSIVTLTYFLCGVMEVGCGIMRGMGSSFIPMTISFIGSCALRILWTVTIFAATPTLQVLYFAYPVSWATTAAAHFISSAFMLNHLKKKMNSRHDTEIMTDSKLKAQPKLK